MWKTILRRILIMIPQLILLSVLVFVLSKMMPGDPLAGNFSQGQSAAQMAALRQQYGLNDPWYIQYVKWIGNMFHGDLGQSFVYKRSVTGLIGERAANTFWLALLSTVILYVIAIPAGVIAGRYEGSKRDSAISIASFILMAVPPFVFYLLGLIFFGFFLQWFPTGGSVSSTYNPGTLGYVWDRIYHMIYLRWFPGLSRHRVRFSIYGPALLITPIRILFEPQDQKGFQIALSSINIFCVIPYCRLRRLWVTKSRCYLAGRLFWKRSLVIREWDSFLYHL